ncbi:MAG: MBL fold metallo-hydrolase, partial [Cytophagaceae bacterium]
MPFARLVSFIVALLITTTGFAQHVGKPLPVWQLGYLDIHQINTGQGNATFIVFPDGTSLLVDAGAINPIDWRTNKLRNNPVKPSTARQAGEWIARYVRNALRFQNKPVIDYAIITHFHDDHMGSPLNVAKRGVGGYVLTGITEVGEYILIRKIMDRGWPNYDYPRSLDTDSMVANYRRFLTWQIQHKALSVEQFKAGRNDQITLLNHPGKYSLEVRNLAVNGEIWTGNENATRTLFPDLSTLKAADYP